MRKDEKTYIGKNFEFTPGWSGFHIKYKLAGYFDERPCLMIYFIWGKLYLFLPWRHYKKIEVKKDKSEIRRDKLKILSEPKFKEKKKYEKELYDECDPPEYGCYFYMRQFGVCYGGKTKLYDLPWYLDWVRTSALGIDGTWFHETPKNRDLEFYDSNKWSGILYSESFPYKYVSKYGEEQKCTATIRVVEREWRWKWFKWLKLIRKVDKDIDITFSDDIGDRKGSYKGGTIGCGYGMLKGETPYETLRRMERERKF